MSKEGNNIATQVIKNEPLQEVAEINSTCQETVIKIETVEPKQEEKLNLYITKEEFRVNEDFYDNKSTSLKLELNDSFTNSNDQLLNLFRIQTRNSTNTKLKFNAQELKCFRCSFVANCGIDYIPHSKTCQGFKQNERQECSYTPKRKHNLLKHTKRHYGTEGFKCHQCNFTTKLKQYLMKHVEAHHGSEELKCAQCSYTSKWKHDLLQHKKVHHSSEELHCHQCSQLYH